MNNKALVIGSLNLFPWELNSMPEYSRTLPSGVTPGKCWRCAEYAKNPTGPGSIIAKWWVGMYGEPETPEGDTVPIYWFEVRVLEGPKPPVYRSPDWSNFKRWQSDQHHLRTSD